MTRCALPWLLLFGTVPLACGFDRQLLGVAEGSAGSAGSAGNAGAAGSGGEPTTVSVGQYAACATRAGNLYCWGNLDHGSDATTGGAVLSTPQPLGTTQGWARVELGDRFACAQRSSALYCWGNSELGQLGLGDLVARTTPELVGGLAAVASFDVGYSHACAVTTDGALYCWGDNVWGRLGLGPDRTETPLPSPQRVGDANDWMQVAAGQYHTCGLRQPGTLYCWGINSSGNLGQGTASDTPVPSPLQVGVRSDWVELSAGQGDTCARSAAGEVWCWGSWGETPVSVLSPTQIVLEAPAVALSTEVFHRCVLAGDGRAWCWGRNIEGQLGLGDLEPRAAPTLLPLSVRSLSVGRFSTCLVDVDGQPRCAGENSSGQLGLGDVERRSTFTPVLLPAP